MNNESKNNSFNKFPTWEILGVIIGYFASVNEAIDLIGHHVLNYNQDSVPHILRIITAASYLAVLIVISGYTLFKNYLEEKKDKITPEEDLRRLIKKGRISRLFKSLGFVLIQEKYLDLFKITTYHYFNRPVEWGPKQGFFDFIMRFRFESKFTVEFQFARDFSKVQYRETTPGSDTFGPEQLKKWNQTNHKWLILSSPKGFFWVLFHYLSFKFLRSENV